MISYNFRYYFTKLNNLSKKPYYTALVGTFSFISNPIFTIGFSRNFLSGGLYLKEKITPFEAALLPLESIFIDSKINNNPDMEAHDLWDQTMAGFLCLEFPASKLKLYLELGTDDHRQNFSDLRSQPDHNSASIIGLRKYDIFNNKYLLSGIEYINIKQSFTYKFRGGGHWWWKDIYDYSSYEGRRWAAHSGSDSDDFYFYFGYSGKHLTFIPGFNYERHGIIHGEKPEVKIEFRLDIKFLIKDYNIDLYLEREVINNLSFTENNNVSSNIICFAISKDLKRLINNNTN